jgi:hypothetical protein
MRNIYILIFIVFLISCSDKTQKISNTEQNIMNTGV